MLFVEGSFVGGFSELEEGVGSTVTLLASVLPPVLPLLASVLPLLRLLLLETELVVAVLELFMKELKSAGLEVTKCTVLLAVQLVVLLLLPV